MARRWQRRGGRGPFWNGRVDEVPYFVGRALSDAEIQAMYAAGSDGLCPLACGNSGPDPGEAGDDANATNGEGSDNACSVTAFGNGVAGGGGP